MSRDVIGTTGISHPITWKSSETSCAGMSVHVCKNCLPKQVREKIASFVIIFVHVIKRFKGGLSCANYLHIQVP